MRNEQEIRALKEELARLNGFIGEHGSAKQFGNRDYLFSRIICHALSWFLGEISTDQFRSDTHINIERLYEQIRAIETTTGKKLTDYE